MASQNVTITSTPEIPELFRGVVMQRENLNGLEKYYHLQYRISGVVPRREKASQNITISSKPP